MNDWQEQYMWIILYMILWDGKVVHAPDVDFLFAQTRPYDIQDELDIVVNMNYN